MLYVCVNYTSYRAEIWPNFGSVVRRRRKQFSEWLLGRYSTLSLRITDNYMMELCNYNWNY